MDPSRPADKGLGIKGWLKGPRQKDREKSKETGGLVPGRDRIAILPFTNISPNPQDEYFADGMTEELISTLSKIATLRVISRTSVMRYKHTEKSVEEISRELNVGSILEGSVRKAADELRITVKLIDVQKDEHVWSQDYERKMENVFAVQKEIARRIVESLPVDFLPKDKRSIEKQATGNVRAYELYLRGRFLWNKRSKDSMTEAIGLFQEAIREDQHYPLPYVGLADAYSLLVINWHMPSNEGYPKAEQALAKALSLDENLGEAHATKGLLLSERWDWEGSEREYKRAIELKPNYATAHHWYGILLGPALGRIEEAMGEAEKAAELDPLSPIINLNLADAYFSTGDLERSAEYLEKALELEPNFRPAMMVRAFLAAERRDFPTAIAFFEEIASKFPEGKKEARLGIAYAYAKSGEHEKARLVFNETSAKPGEDYVSWLDIAQYYSALGDKDSAFKALNQAFENHDEDLCNIKGFPEFRTLFSDPRFTDLLTRMKLPTQAIV